MSLESTEDELIAGYVLGNLTPQEQAEVQKLLSTRPDLARKVGHLQETWQNLAYTLPEVGLPPPLRGQILAAALAPPLPIPLRRRVYWPESGWGIAALLVLGLGLDSLRLRQALEQAQIQVQHQQDVIAMLGQGQTKLVSFKSSTPQSGASGNLMITPGYKEAVLTLQDVAPLPDGEVYRLWAVVGGKKLACGEFTPNGQGRVFVKLPVDQNFTKSPLIVTLEPTKVMPEPSGPMVLTSGL